jgi:organic radical activating enzyme
LSDTFCIRAFDHLSLNLDGTAQLCCRAHQPIAALGRPMSLATDTYGSIWNSQYMQRVRQSLLSGQHIPDCVACYEHERTTGTSLRRESNDAWLERQPEGQRASAVATLKSRAEVADYRVDGPPHTLHLWFGSHCNLQCRMCSAEFSTRIAADPVHRSWHPANAGPRPKARFVDASTWSDSDSVLFGEVFHDVDALEAVAFAGGEPLLQKQIDPLLDFLIERGRAPFMRLFVSTNGMVFRESLLEKLSRFQKVVLAISLDGVGALNDYIRFPARFDVLLSNLDAMKRFPGVQLRVDPTIQAYNVLRLADLLRFCDASGLDVSLSNILLSPTYLAVACLPASCIEMARDRLQAYLGASAPERNLAAVRGILAHLDTLPGPEQPALLQDFMTFTNDLDASRQQRLRDVLPELPALLEQAGFPWQQTRRFVPVVSALA